ncbi:MAG: M1 family metallopeptidase [Sandaracinus sp.]
MRFSGLACFAALSLALGACGGEPPEEPVAEVETTGDETVAEAPPVDEPPLGPLPEDVTPTRYALSLRVVPSEERFRGTADIRVTLAQPTTRIWMHGTGLHVSTATISPGLEGAAAETAIAARWEPSAHEGVDALRFDTPVGPGSATIHIEYDAAFDRQLKGLYRVDVGEDHYAFTQFEATSARYAFPGFDEPRFKTPFDITLDIPATDRAVSNGSAIETSPLDEGMQRVRFRTTEPLPTYLVAMAVGPLDIVEAPPIPASAVRSRPLPLRGVAARGRGAELAYALAHTPAIVASLESYFGMEYPYEKLDIIAVPDFAAGAMENAGAITFRESLLLLGEHAPEDQVRAFTNVMAHELAHHWFGDLVTMPWWDDIWLNEAFATWMATRVVRDVAPEQHAELGSLAGIHGAMGADSLAAARQIRQPIETEDDIRNAFDSITYQKGSAVLAMFERWIGEDTFRDGIRAYLGAHRFGTARSEDLLAALAQASGRDVATPFFSFLEQPGVPLVSANLSCGEGGRFVDLTQRRYTPTGSEIAATGATWSIPVCVRYGRGRTTGSVCTLLNGPSQRLAIPSEQCPEWVLPNQDASGYYRWTLAPEDLTALMEHGLPSLTPAERLSLASNLRAAYVSGALPVADALSASEALTRDASHPVAVEPMMLLATLIDYLSPEERREEARAYARSLYVPRFTRLGWAGRGREDGETRLLRRDMASFLVRIARDPATRARAATLGETYLGIGHGDELHPDAVEPTLIATVLVAAVNQADAARSTAVFDALVAHLVASTDAIVRTNMLIAIGSAEDPALAARALALGADPRLRVNEVTIPIGGQVDSPEGRLRAWEWAQTGLDSLLGRVATTRGGAMPLLFAGFCDAEHRAGLEAMFTPRLSTLPGSPRNLRSALEAISLCAARVEAQRASALSFLDAHQAPARPARR